MKPILVGEVMVEPTTKVCKCGRKCIDHASNGLDPYVVCSGCLKDVCDCPPLIVHP
jgi:hypothetical protein